jgi:hypothetical protein
MTYSNPRLVAEFDDWPIGGSNRGQCKFNVCEGGKRGVRVSRMTTSKLGVWCKPKYTNYFDKAVIVDGEDGRTYVLSYSGRGMDSVAVWRSDFMQAEEGYVFKTYNPSRFAELMAIIDTQY